MRGGPGGFRLQRSRDNNVRRAARLSPDFAIHCFGWTMAILLAGGIRLTGPTAIGVGQMEMGLAKSRTARCASVLPEWV